MKHILLACLIGLFGSTLVVIDAEARRLGGGKSLGRSAPSHSQSAAPQQRQATDAQRQNPTAAPPQRSGASRWLGPLAGLAAGGLLAALLFGDGFEGFQILDFLLLALLAFMAFKLFRALRGQSAPMARTAHATAGGGAHGGFEHQQPPAGGGAEQLQGVHRPGWFNESEFLKAAKAHFIRLQAAWDQGDMQDIREYTTPELFAELTLERQSYGGERQFTEVVSLDAELLDLAREGERIVASVRYWGLIREQQGAEAQPFSEIWHIQRKESEANANWYVAGIEQVNRG